MRLSCAHCACPKFVLGGQLGLDWSLARSQFTLALLILGVTCTFVRARLIQLERLRLLWLVSSLGSFAVQGRLVFLEPTNTMMSSKIIHFHLPPLILRPAFQSQKPNIDPPPGFPKPKAKSKGKPKPKPATNPKGSNSGNQKKLQCPSRPCQRFRTEGAEGERRRQGQREERRQARSKRWKEECERQREGQSGKSLRMVKLFLFLTNRWPLHDIVALTCKSKSRKVFVYDHKDKTATLSSDKSTPWMHTFLLTHYHKKLRFISKKGPDPKHVIASVGHVLHKVAWKAYFEDEGPNPNCSRRLLKNSHCPIQASFTAGN